MSNINTTQLPNGDAILSMNFEEKKKIDVILEKAREFAKEHHIAIGIAEMAAGAACITFGCQSGAIQMGRDIVALATGKADTLASKIGVIGGVGGAVAGAIIGGIGIASGGTAIGIPAAIVCMGAGWIFGSSGFTATKLIQSFVGEVNIDFATILTGGSLLSIGTFLLLDGAWRCVSDDTKETIKKKVKESISMISDRVIYLAKCTWKIIAKTAEELAALFASAVELLNNDKFKKALIGVGGVTAATAGGIGGGILGGSIAASSVTVLGSQALGSLALSLGLISAPLWPVVLLGGTGVLVGSGAFLGIRKLFSSKLKDDELLAMQIIIIAFSQQQEN